MIIKVIGSAEDKPISVKIKDLQYVDGIITNYERLTDKPQINGHELSGIQSAEDLELGRYTKPDGGIPKTDLSSAVVENLNEAHTAMERLNYNATNSDVGKALVAEVVSNGKVTNYSLEEITRPYFIETSSPAIYYDESASIGEKLSPSRIVVDAYRTEFDGSIRKAIVDSIESEFCRVDGTVISSSSASYSSGVILTVSQVLPPDSYLKVELRNNSAGANVCQRLMIPVVSMPATSKIDKPANPETGAFLVWNGTEWIAQTFDMWQGGIF